MEVCLRMMKKQKEREEREYELANPCTHEGSINHVFVWDGQTMCSYCCEHEYRDHIVNDDTNGQRVCTLCMCMLGQAFKTCWPQRPRKRKKRIPKICVFDENGKQRRVKYSPNRQQIKVDLYK